MRPRICTAAGVVCLFTAATANAQQQQASSFLTGVPPGAITNTLGGKPFDLSKANAARPGQQALQSRFNFSTLFNKLAVPSFPGKRGVSALPAPSSFPSTTYQNGRLVGTPPYPLSWMFGNNRPSPIAPMPIIPNPGQTPVGPGSSP